MRLIRSVFKKKSLMIQAVYVPEEIYSDGIGSME